MTNKLSSDRERLISPRKLLLFLFPVQGDAEFSRRRGSRGDHGVPRRVPRRDGPGEAGERWKAKRKVRGSPFDPFHGSPRRREKKTRGGDRGGVPHSASAAPSAGRSPSLRAKSLLLLPPRAFYTQCDVQQNADQPPYTV